LDLAGLALDAALYEPIQQTCCIVSAVGRNRRLARDFYYAKTAAAFARVTVIRTMLRRLAANVSL